MQPHKFLIVVDEEVAPTIFGQSGTLPDHSALIPKDFSKTLVVLVRVIIALNVAIFVENKNAIVINIQLHQNLLATRHICLHLLVLAILAHQIDTVSARERLAAEEGLAIVVAPFLQ